MLTVNHITKQFYALKALNDVTLTVQPGEVLGLLGPNGAGKTTLFKLMAGLLTPDKGEIRPLNGHGWPTIGYKPDRLLFPDHMRVSSYLKMIAGLSNIPPAHIDKAVFDSLVKVDLIESANKRIQDCSKGMRQRLGLAQVLIGDPPLLLLDEPSNGLDPNAQADMHRRIHELHAAGKTIIISSHHLPEVANLCTQIIILNKGRIYYENSMEQALATRTHTTIEVDKELTLMEPTLTAMHEDIEVAGKVVTLRNEALPLRREIITMLLSADYDVLRVGERKRSLAEIYGEIVA